MAQSPSSSKALSASDRPAEAGERLAGRAAAVLIRAYRLIVRPILPATCRFFPSCSLYAEEAIRAHGAVRGTGLALRRVARCHPWHAGGFDPVPVPPGPSRS